jgi:trimethylamine--corrinoid protein Co-methyltransferase
MTDTNHARPTLTLLDEEQIQIINQSALQILSQTGVRVDSEPVRRLLEKRAGASALQGDRVRLPGELVEWALQTAPSTVYLYDRQGNFAFRLGEGRARFGIGVTTLFYQDPGDDSLVPFARQHMQDMVRLGGRLPNFDVISTLGSSGCATHLSDL